MIRAERAQLRGPAQHAGRVSLLGSGLALLGSSRSPPSALGRHPGKVLAEMLTLQIAAQLGLGLAVPVPGSLGEPACGFQYPDLASRPVGEHPIGQRHAGRQVCLGCRVQPPVHRGAPVPGAMGKAAHRTAVAGTRGSHDPGVAYDTNGIGPAIRIPGVICCAHARCLSFLASCSFRHCHAHDGGLEAVTGHATGLAT